MPIDPISGSSVPYGPSKPNDIDKKALMDSFTQIKNSSANSIQSGIVNQMFGIKGTQPEPLDLSFAYPAPDIVDFTNSQLSAQESGTSETTKTEPIPEIEDINSQNEINAGKTLDVNITPVARNSGNIISGPDGFSSQENSVQVNGANNIIDLRGTPGENESLATFNLTGGPNIDNTQVTVTGDSNSIQFSGSQQDNNTITINGNGNSVQIGNNVDNTDINLSGSNIQVEIKDDNILKKDQDQFTINVSVSDVSIRLENGKAVVEGLNGNENFTAEIDLENRSITVSAIS